jgi:hypothetical protein
MNQKSSVMQLPQFVPKALTSDTSEMIDNTNGLIVMRSYLTTLFFIDKSIIADGD